MDEPRANVDSQNSLRLGLGGSHHLPPYSIFCASPRGQHPKCHFVPWFPSGSPKFPKLGLTRLWRLIILCENLELNWGLKQSCSPHQKKFNDMWHVTCMQGSQGNYQLLVIGSQIDNLTPNLFFGHNLCFNYPNGSCEPILDIYVLKAF
jgi:hypothetical protein